MRRLVGWIGLNLMWLVLLVRLLRMGTVKRLNMMLLLGLHFFQEVGMGSFVAVVGDGGGDGVGVGDGGGDHHLHP